MSKTSPFHRAVVEALRDCLEAHGPVEKKNMGSAAKRIVPRVEKVVEDQIDWYRHKLLIAERKITKLQKEIFRLGQAS